MLTMLIQGPVKCFPSQEEIENEFNHRKGSEAQSDAEAVLAAADADIVSKEKQEENHSHLNDAHASLAR